MQAMQPIMMMLVMFGIFYFILIRPQVKRQREHQALLNKLDKGLQASPGNLYHYLHYSIFDPLFPFRIVDLRP